MGEKLLLNKAAKIAVEDIVQKVYNGSVVKTKI